MRASGVTWLVPSGAWRPATVAFALGALAIFASVGVAAAQAQDTGDIAGLVLQKPLAACHLFA